MARYGSERIRGHGIPEAHGGDPDPRQPDRAARRAAEADLVGDLDRFGRAVRRGGADHHDGRRVRIDPRPALPPDAAERKTLLVAGAAAGMSATFASPIAADAARRRAAAVRAEAAQLDPGRARVDRRGAAMRRYLLGAGPLFPVPAHRRRRRRPAGRCWPGAWSSALLAGGLSATADGSGLRGEDSFAAAAPCTGCGGRRSAASSSASAASSVRRRSASATTRSRHAAAAARASGRTLRLMVVKAGDLGGFARLGNVGRRARAAADHGRRAGRRGGAFLPAYGAGFWPLVSMAAILAGTMRAPLTALVFAIELTGRFSLASADPDRRDRRAHVHGAGPQAVDPDGEGRAPRLPPEPRVRDRSAGDPVRARGDAARGGRAAGRDADRGVPPS